MKLHKRKVRIAISLLVILTIVLSLCSFTPPSFTSTTAINFTSFTSYDVENLMAIANFQHVLGSFTSLFPVYCRFRQVGALELVLLQTGSSYSLSENSSGQWSLTTSGMTISAQFTDEGFTLISENVSNTSNDRLLFYRSEESSDFIVNSSFGFFSTGNSNDNIADIASYWYDFYSNVINYESNIQSSFNNGYNTGFSEGESSGYQDGYSSGFFEGESSGYRTGYDEGLDYGYEAGFDAGYDTGYDSGFNDGLESAEPGEVVTEIIYRDAVDLNFDGIFNGISSIPQNILGSSLDFTVADINIAGLLRLLLVVIVISGVIIYFVKKP